MEQRFGHDFSRVRTHIGEQAEASARAVNALAYTVGQHVVFSKKLRHRICAKDLNYRPMSWPTSSSKNAGALHPSSSRGHVGEVG